EAHMGLTFPRLLVEETLWDFAGQPVFYSRAEFEAAIYRHLREIEEYAPEIRAEEHWRPKDIILNSSCVLVRYCYDAPGGELAWDNVQLSSDNGSSFSAGELLYKLHNAIIGNVRDSGHRYFEGLGFEEIVAGNVPVYCMILGS